MSSDSDGPALYSLLSSLGLPSLSLLSPEGLDWLFESPNCLPFLQWVVSTLGQDNVVEGQDLAAFSALPGDKLLSGQILAAALASCGLGEGQLSDQHMERQVAELEQELGLQEECRDKLEHIKEVLGDQAVREQARAGQVEHLVERAERDERRKQEQVLVVNSNYNQVVGRLVAAVQKVSGVYQSAKADEDNPMFISSVPLERVKAADSCLEEELQRLMEVYFSKGTGGVGENQENANPIIDINDPVCLELVKGRDKQEFELLASEISRLRVSFSQAEIAKLTYQAEEAGWQAVMQLLTSQMNIVGQNKVITATPRRVRPEIIEPREKLEKEMVELVEQLANSHCQHILTTDYKTKASRNKLVVERLEGVRDILLQQATRREILAVAMNREMGEVDMVKNIFENIIKDFKEETLKMNNFKTAVRSLRVRKNEANLIPPEDLVMLGAHKVLQNHGLVGHLATYNAVREAVEELEEKKKKLDGKLDELKTSRRDEINLMEKKISRVLKMLNINDSGVSKNVSLAPKDIKHGMNSLDSGLKDIEKVVKKLLDRWEKDKSELKIKPQLRLQREVWVDFLVKPQVLAANVKSLVNKVKD
eukprot:GFUD01042437.1.p1 GENE.GFUD01042437.1~~GFUD01042437.1.p1  ORF type:complete len:594 (+),score=252.69 GFUD01042437.1:63-1844(+)